MKNTLTKTIKAFCLVLLAAVAFHESPAIAADVYAAILAKKEIRVGISQHYPPLNFESGKKGLEVEMATRLGEFLGVKVVLVPLGVKDYVPALEKKKVDIICAGFSRNLTRGRTIWFSVPYLTVTPAVLAQKRILPKQRYGDQFEESPISTIWDLENVAGFSFAVKAGSSYEELLKDHFPKNRRITVLTNEEGLALLEKGDVDGLVHDSLFLQYLYNKSASMRSSYKLLQGGRQAEKICIGIPFGETVLKNQIDLFIEEMTRQGHVDRWLQKYSGE